MYSPAKNPTIYFIGVTTDHSAIRKIFPKWMSFLGLPQARLVGVDIPLGAPPEAYRKIIAFIKSDSMSRGALVTTHKIDLLNACTDLFDSLEDQARILDEVSCVYKKGNQLIAEAKDAITSRLAMEAFLPTKYWLESKADVVCLGAGGASVAVTTALLQGLNGNFPQRIFISDINPDRIEHIQKIHKQLNIRTDLTYHLIKNTVENDQLVMNATPGSLIINGTGMGKDLPGSPVSDKVLFPKNSFVWDYNYRGILNFLQQAQVQSSNRQLKLVDGWVYFIYGWTQVLAEVFHINIPVKGPGFGQLVKIAGKIR